MEHYGTVEGFLEYCEKNGYDVTDLPSSPSDEIEIILRRGSSYVDGRYQKRFPGRRTDGRAQTWQWPRTGAVDSEGEELPDDEVPIEVEHATYEAAIREYQTPGSLVPDYLATERVQSESVGPLSVTYATSSTLSAGDAWPVVGVIDMILEPILTGGKTSMLFGEVTR